MFLIANVYKVLMSPSSNHIHVPIICCPSVTNQFMILSPVSNVCQNVSLLCTVISSAHVKKDSKFSNLLLVVFGF